ncbi:diguanylate cyclase [Mycobacterium sp. E2462]|uniref:sensor domain-containing diguanylate cyclase n=1 Tax=Mycobacterium sp. E2462 TaxID=1834133 RepID=UPI0007FC03EF|nr:sensor domain-containing diguanylate cyclase [Mycobacterium sp. E2462]OBI02868.1 diguanylate cyclase [Mycobacterium sp. E2462]
MSGIRDDRVRPALGWCAGAAVVVVLLAAAVTWLGWTTRTEALTRIYPSWPPMTPWTALSLAALGVGIVLQSGRPSRGRVWTGRGLAAAAGLLAVVFLAEYGAGRSFGVDRVWFADTVRRWQTTLPGRPSPQTAASVLLVAAAVALVRVDRGTRLLRPLCMAAGAVVPLVTVGAYLFDAIALVGVSPSTGQAVSTASALLLLVAAIALTRPDTLPLAWLLARPDGVSLARLAGIFAGFPIVVALSRPAFSGMGLDEHAQWTFAILLGTLIAGAVTFYFSQREQQLLIEKELVSKERAEAEARYRILADNAVDIIVHLRGADAVWVSPSVQTSLGGPLDRWMGPEFRRRVHPEDRDGLASVLTRIAGGEPVLHRFRLRSTDDAYHWVDGHGKPYLGAHGRADGLIAALRIVDDQVEAERRLERLARFDTLTGLVNRAEALRRLDVALAPPQPFGTCVGVLFCDVDRFKQINDTWGHGIGDAVLATLAARIRGSVRKGDTVGRTGGDEMLVLLPGVEKLEEVTRIAEKIRDRAAEPIILSGNEIRATLSIGATLAGSGEAVDAIMARADAAMYRAKSGHCNAISPI